MFCVESVISVIAYFNEGPETLEDAIKQVVDRLPLFTRHRVIIYVKNGEHTEQAVQDMLVFGDEVVWLPNVGREGETYLVSARRVLDKTTGSCLIPLVDKSIQQAHITRHYETAATNIAKHTIFMQVRTLGSPYLTSLLGLTDDRSASHCLG